MTSTSATAMDTPEGVELLQRRVSSVGKVLAIVFALGQTFNTVTSMAARGLGSFVEPGNLLAWLGVGCSVAMWLLCRGPVRSRRYVETVEAVTILGAVVVVSLMSRYINLQVIFVVTDFDPAIFTGGAVAPPVAALAQLYMAHSLMLGVLFPFALRAALVPSTVRRTAVLTAVAALPLIAIVALGWVPFEADHTVREATTPGAKRMIATTIVVWWTLATIVCVAITKTVHNLRREVRAAMQLGQYTLDRQLGEGGMGVVYRAHHALMRRPTAIKLLSPDKAGAASLARFEREVQLTAQLTHPNTITVFDYGRTPEGLLYYAMELLDGATLEDVVEHDGAQPEGRVIRVLSMVAGALAEAHGVGLIHRDIKPANIVLCEQGGEVDVAKVLDFGLVKAMREPEDAGLTRDGIVTGTPQYMPPEAMTDPEKVDERSDIYALGAVGYFFLTGKHLFKGATMVEVCSHHLHTRPVRPSKRLGRQVAKDLEKLLLCCLAKQPGDRPQSARDLRRRLLACADAAAWDSDKAEAWWAEHGAALHPSQRTLDTRDGRTLAVDLGRGR
ncbi:MAG: serine/threonine protein kinase [Deltaproteobacteria bacterium]|jgi:serine/threonine-protein kinase|nr:serine/threonine protein kinase [Deltaproteobacteria bacterium]MBW2530536.1 serine/threonine protein kinase [Deltaproteobacteria bacterium]